MRNLGSKLTPVRYRFLLAGVIAALAYACGTTKNSPSETIVSTTADAQPSSPNSKTDVQGQPDDLKAQMIEDGRTAATLLLKAACEEKSDIGTMAAIYARRVGLAPDSGCEQEALLRGIDSTYLLVRALSWRRLIERVDINVSSAKNVSTEDPAILVLTSLAFLSRNQSLPVELASALSLPPGSPCNVDRSPQTEQRSNELKVWAWPFDDGLLSSAVAFTESVYEEVCAISNDRPVWAADGLRQSLFDSIGLSDEKAKAIVTGSAPKRQTALDESLDNPLVKQQAAVLTNIALFAEPALRIEALRAEIIQGGAPSADRLAAAARALRSDNLALRIEGARSFLLFVRQL
jgi:hypothetical protein